MNLPNKITLGRIILIPFMLIIPLFNIEGSLFGISNSNLIILAIFLIASFTDYLDGYLARKNNMITNFGKFLDPIADKLLVLAALIMLVETNMIPGWIPIVIAAREFIVSGIRMLAAGEGNVIAASWLGKVKTVSQIIAISLAFVDTNAFFAFTNGLVTGWALVLNILTSLSMLVCVATTIWSGTDYFIKSKEIVLRNK